MSEPWLTALETRWADKVATRRFDKAFAALGISPPGEDEGARNARLRKGIALAYSAERWSALATVADELHAQERRLAGEPPVYSSPEFSRSPRTVIVVEDVEPETAEEQGIA